MPHVTDYIQWRGDIPFENDPLNEVDNLIFCLLSYVELDGAVPSTPDRCVTLREAAKEYFFTHDPKDERPLGLIVPREIVALFRQMADAPRYRDLQLCGYVNEICEKKQVQFSALTIRLPDDTWFAAVRGTDDTIVGWREDFNLSWMDEVPAQRLTAEYLDNLPLTKNSRLYVGGHSKGGNLAIYAAMNADPKVRKRIQHVYSLDGPGFPPEIVTSPAYRTIQPKVTKIVPSSSIVGMIFETPEPCRVVSSDSDGIMQHSAFTWLLDGDQFITEPDLSSSSQLFNEELNHWIATLTPEQRERAVDALFTVLHANGATSFSEVMSNFPASIPAMLGAYVGLTPADRRHLVEALAILFKASTAKRKPTPAPASAPSSATSKATAEIPAETAAGADSAAPARADTDADAGTTASPSAEDATEIAD